jgi:CRISPR type III-A-associated protein Csm2
MTQESPAERLRRLGGVGGQSQQPRSNPGGPRPQQGRPSGGQGGPRGGGGGRDHERGGGGYRGGGSGRPPQPRLPEGYLEGGYFDDKGNIHEGLIVNDALAIAQQLEAGGMTRSQLRVFYNEVADIRRLLRRQPAAFNQLKARILKLRAFAHNATTRRTNKAPQMFYDFIVKNAELAAQKPDNFSQGFCEHFECVVLYFRGR